MGKYERMQKRKERKDAERAERARLHDEHKARHDEKHGKNKRVFIRRDQHGNYIIKGYLKATKLSIVIIVFVGLLISGLTWTLLTNTETAGQCANPFCNLLDAIFGPGEEPVMAQPTSGVTEPRELPLESDIAPP